MADYQALDEAYQELLAVHPEPPGGSLLAQTLATGPARRRLLPLVPLRPGWRVLDLGTGFGPLAFELAWSTPIEVVGVDADLRVLAEAQALADRLGGAMAPGASVRFALGDAAALDSPPEQFDLVTARLLFQHLAEPVAVAAEIRRVLRPGGFVFVVDVDDGLSAAYPPPEGALAVLERAFDAWQASYGGDRAIGRKLSSVLAGAGLAIEAVTVVPQGEHRREVPGDLVRSINVARFRAAREPMAAAGILAAEDLDRLVAEYAVAPAMERCRIECQVAVVARRPEGPSSC